MSGSSGFGQRLLGVFGIEVASGIARICVPVLMARIIGAGPYGLYVTSTNLTSLIFNLAASGLPLAAIYYSATLPGRRTTHQLLTCAAALAFAAVFISTPGVLYYRKVALENLAPTLLLVAAASAIPYAVELTALGILRGQGRIERAASFGCLRQLLLVAMACLLAYIGGSPERAIVGFGVCTVMLSAITSTSAIRTAASPSEVAPPTFKDIGRYAALVQTSTFLTFLNYRVTLFLLAALASPAAVGIYGAALTIAEGVWLFSHVVSGVLVGEVASQQLEGKRRELTARACRLVTAASVVAAAAATCFSKPIMSVFGREFAMGWSSLGVLMLGASALAPSRILASHQAALGAPHANIRGTVAGLIVNVVFTLALVPTWGLVGAATANALSYVVVAADRIRTFIGSGEGCPMGIRHLLIPNANDFRALVRALPIKSLRLSAVSDDEG
jgi:O-antigen/teichoic acid export membrane protein